MPPPSNKANAEAGQPKKAPPSLERQRMLISLFYEHTLDLTPPCAWLGESGTITSIMRGLKLKGTKRNMVKLVVKRTYDMYLDGKMYKGEIKHNGGKSWSNYWRIRWISYGFVWLSINENKIKDRIATLKQEGRWQYKEQWWEEVDIFWMGGRCLLQSWSTWCMCTHNKRVSSSGGGTQHTHWYLSSPQW